MIEKRQEIKFRLDHQSLNDLIRIKNLKKIYPKRNVNSVYFDTVDFKFHHKSEEGQVPRKKVRIRYYDKNIGNSKIEIKSSFPYYRIKDVHNIDLNNILDLKLKLKKIDNKNYLYPKLKVKYLRDYYSCDIGRITIDSNIRFKKIISYGDLLNNSYNLSKDLLLDKYYIIELKTKNDISKYEAIKFMNQNDTRFSKYCYGINKIYFFK